MRRSYGLAKLIEEALIRPPHRPPVVRTHVADEYSAIAARAGDKNGQYENKVIAGELRRGLSGRVDVRDGVTVV